MYQEAWVPRCPISATTAARGGVPDAHPSVPIREANRNRMGLAKTQLVSYESEPRPGALGADSNHERIRRGGSGREQTHLLESLVQAGTAKRVSFSRIASWVGCALTHCAAVRLLRLGRSPIKPQPHGAHSAESTAVYSDHSSMDLLQSILERIRQSVGCSFTTGKLLRHGRRVVRSAA